MSQLDKVIDMLAESMPEAMKHMNAFLKYEGDNPKYYQKSKVAGGMMSSYVKAEATKTNRMAVDQAALRMTGQAALRVKELSA